MSPQPKYLARYAKEHGGRLIGEFSNLQALSGWAARQGCPDSWVEVGLWNGETWDWHNFGHLVTQ